MRGGLVGILLVVPLARVGLVFLVVRGSAHAEAADRVSGVLASRGCLLDRVVHTATGSVWAVHDDLHATADRDDEGHAAIAADREITLAFLTFRSPVAASGYPRPVNDSAPTQAAAPAM